MTPSKDANMHRIGKSSLIPRNARTLALHMAMEAAQRAEVGERIRELRGVVPQPVLAQRLGVSLRTIQKWERGESAPQWENLVQLSKHFGVSQDFLLYGEREQSNGNVEVNQLDRIERNQQAILNRLEQVLAILSDDDIDTELAERFAGIRAVVAPTSESADTPADAPAANRARATRARESRSA